MDDGDDEMTIQSDDDDVQVKLYYVVNVSVEGQHRRFDPSWSSDV